MARSGNVGNGWHMAASFERRYLLLGLRIAGDFGATIAIPVVILALVGKTADRHYGTWPWLTVCGFVTAAVITYFLIRRKAVKYAERYQSLINEETKSRKEESP